MIDFVDTFYRVRSKFRRMTGLGPPERDPAEYIVPQSQASELALTASGPLAEIFFNNQGRAVWKWVHYLPIYERYFESFRGQSVRLLEIGIYKGGSLDMWRRYFGPEATIFGIDLNPAFAANVDAPNEARVGSQDDPAFLARVVAEMGGVDIVIDDGSHFGPHQRASFQALFPLLSDGGLYVIEDLHASYWRHRRSISGITFFKRLVDDMHHWYHDRGIVGAGGEWISAIHFYDSMVLIEKAPPQRPISIEIGSDADVKIPGIGHRYQTRVQEPTKGLIESQ